MDASRTGALEAPAPGSAGRSSGHDKGRARNPEPVPGPTVPAAVPPTPEVSLPWLVALLVGFMATLASGVAIQRRGR